MKNLDPRYTFESALEVLEHITRAYNLVSALHTEAQAENARLQKRGWIAWQATGLSL